MLDEGIEKNITIRTSSERESVIYTSVGHRIIFQLTSFGNDGQTLLFYEGKLVTRTLYLIHVL